MPIASIIFLQGDEGHRVTGALTHTEDLVRHGVTAASIEAVVNYLAQWDSGEYHDIGSTTRAGAHDDRVQVDSYLLTWNAPLGYVGLEVILDGINHAHSGVETCRGCDEPIDMCQDHTHAPDTESEEWTTDYDAVTALCESEI